MNPGLVPGGRLLEGRVVLVTGGASGLGLGMATAMAAHGAAVVLACRRSETGEPAAAGLREAGHDVRCVRCDVTSADDLRTAVDATVTAHGRLDCMVHNAIAPTGGPTRIQDVAQDHWDAMVGTAIRATFEGARAAHPHLREAGGSMILMTSSADLDP